MSKRRGHGEGSIHKRADGRWAAAIDLGWQDGKRRRKYVYGKTRRETAEKLTIALRTLQQGMPLGNEKQTCGQYLDWWLHEMVAGSVRPSTLGSYAEKVRLHIQPELGRVPLVKLTPTHIQSLLNRKLADGLSPRSVQYIHAVLRRALTHAERLGLVSRNVAKLVQPPRTVQREVIPLTVDEAQRLLALAREDRLFALYVLALGLGLRQGELLGLHWQDIDLETEILRVRVALGRGESQPTFTEPKSARARRAVPLPPTCTTALRAHRIRQAEQRLAAGTQWADYDLVFTTGTGRPIDARNLLRQFKRLCARAQIGDRRFHDLRHTCASFLLAQGQPARVVMEVLGHSQISLTMNTYAHVMPTVLRDALDEMDVLLRS